MHHDSIFNRTVTTGDEFAAGACQAGAGSVYWACGRRAASYSCYWLVKPRGSHDSINKEGQQPLQQDMYSPKPTRYRSCSTELVAAAPCNYGCRMGSICVYMQNGQYMRVLRQVFGHSGAIGPREGRL